MEGSILVDPNHSERLAVLPYLVEPILEIGCGYRKTVLDSVGLDLTPRGGSWYNRKGRVSQADIVADGSLLPFAPDSFSTVLARHVLEHFLNLQDTILEWRRVLRQRGSVVVVVPDEGRFPGTTLDLDPTHLHAWTQPELKTIFEEVGFRNVTTKNVEKPAGGYESFCLRAER